MSNQNYVPTPPQDYAPHRRWVTIISSSTFRLSASSSEVLVAVRHSAASDAFATALLMARLLPGARRQGASTFAEMQKLARASKWLQ